MLRGLLCAIVLLLALLSLPDNLTIHVHAARCVGATPCNACSSCSSCQYCAKNGGTCGVCAAGIGGAPQSSDSWPLSIFYWGAAVIVTGGTLYWLPRYRMKKTIPKGDDHA